MSLLSSSKFVLIKTLYICRMISEEGIAARLAEFLLQIKAIKLQPDKPFTWSSGWKSPIYTDNRVTLSYPQIRTFIRQQLSTAVLQHFGNPSAVAGVATGGIAHGVLLAQEWGVPFVYVRPDAKSHGTQSQIEGSLEGISQVLVVEDLVSTGKSSLAAVKALREQGVEVKHMVSIFDYGFPSASEIFTKEKVQLISLCDYPSLIKKALELDYVREEDMQILNAWRLAPDKWTGE
jgi:orotate phosphoribosyltransferase